MTALLDAPLAVPEDDVRRLPHVVLDMDHLQKVVDYFLTKDSFVFDVETRSVPGMPEYHHDPAKHPNALNWRINEVYWISLATFGLCVAIPMGHPHGLIIGEQPAPMKPGQQRTSKRVPIFAEPPQQLLPAQVFEALRPLFFNEDIVKWGHNVKFDLLSCQKYWGALPTRPFGDTLVLAHMLDENRSLKLIDLIKGEFNHSYEKIGKTLEKEGFDRAASYSFMDSKYTWLWMLNNIVKLEAWELDDLYDSEEDVLEVLLRMETTGAPVRLDKVQELDVVLRAEMQEIEAYLFQEAGQEFMLTANEDKAWFVFDVCEHKPYMFTAKRKERSTAAAAFTRYESDPRVKKMLEWDDLHKLHSTYVVNFLSYIHEGRIHADFKQAGTVTGRFSCAEPNLQNIPQPSTPVGKQLRALFWGGSDDYCLVVGDYSQIELRVLTHFSRDPVMTKAFMEGQDIHQATADTLGIPRTIGKNINFAIPFGAGPTKIAAMAGVPESVAKKHYMAHKEQFPRVWSWIDQTKRAARKERPPHVRTLFGRVRRLPGVFARDDDVRARAERQAVNTKIQGSAADLIKRAMVRIHDSLEDDMFLVLQVHDELVVLTPRDKAERCAEIMSEAMEGPEMQVLRVPVTANIKIVNSWDEAK